MAIEMLTNFLLASVQDLGRKGYARFGYRTCGVCDRYAMQAANLLCGNTSMQEAVIEFTAMGGRLRFTEDTLFSVTGANCRLLLDDKAVPMYCGIPAKAGQCLTISSPTAGFRMYLAVAGGIAVEPVMGSRSTDMDCHFGGFHGRALEKGDIVPAERSACSVIRSLPPDAALKPPARNRIIRSYHIPVLRLVPGPQEEMFSEEAMELFCRSLYSIGKNSNRMGCRMSGPALPVRFGDIISDPIVSGAVQIPSNGLPIIMMADHQTAGGYAKIGTLIQPDQSRLAQMRPGDLAAFSFVSVAESAELLRREMQALQTMKKYLAKRRDDRVFHRFEL